MGKNRYAGRQEGREEQVFPVPFLWYTGQVAEIMFGGIQIGGKRKKQKENSGICAKKPGKKTGRAEHEGSGNEAIGGAP